MRKKLAGGHKLKILLTFFLILFFYKNVHSSEIYDYQTKQIIDKISNQIIVINSFDKKINIKIINSNFPNAFVTKNNTIYITSGLIISSPDYVSLLGVIAHEIGHLHKYHLPKRLSKINNFKKINSYGNIAAVIGSMIIQKPELINSVLINNTTINNFYINFTQEQEIEADYYAAKTLQKLNLSSNSLKELLEIIEKQTSNNIFDEEVKNFSSHPKTKTRIKILDQNILNENTNFDYNLQNDFNFIKAKFMAYTDYGAIKLLIGDYRLYYDAIQLSQSGNLKKSLKILNYLISKHKKYNFLIETKADILLSYGYTKEAIKFYEKILINEPENNYIKYNIFVNLNTQVIDENKNKKFFLKNISLLELFPANKILLIKFYELSKILKLNDWNIFFNIILDNKESKEEDLEKLKINTKDNNLKKIIKLYT